MQYISNQSAVSEAVAVSHPPQLRSHGAWEYSPGFSTIKACYCWFFFFYSMMYFTFRDASSRTSKQTCLCKRCEKYSIYIEIIKISPNICSTKGQCKSQQKFQRSRLEEDVSVPACYFFSLPDGRFCFSYQRQASHLFIVLIIMSKNDCSVWFY